LSRSSTIIIPKFLIKQEALKNCIRGKGKDTHEDRSYHVGNDPSYKTRRIGLGDSIMGFVPFIEHQVAEDNSGTNNEQLAKNIKMQPIVWVTPNLRQFFTTKRKAFIADLQKFLLVSAT